jgi:hypothetical protein
MDEENHDQIFGHTLARKLVLRLGNPREERVLKS